MVKDQIHRRKRSNLTVWRDRWSSKSSPHIRDSKPFSLKLEQNFAIVLGPMQTKCLQHSITLYACIWYGIVFPLSVLSSSRMWNFNTKKQKNHPLSKSEWVLQLQPQQTCSSRECSRWTEDAGGWTWKRKQEVLKQVTVAQEERYIRPSWYREGRSFFCAWDRLCFWRSLRKIEFIRWHWIQAWKEPHSISSDHIM